jgi:hypothetical protein
MLTNPVRLIAVAIIALNVPGVYSGALDPSGPPAPSLIAGLRVATPITAVPVTIEESGVYYLTDSFTVASEFGSGIAVTADDVVIDLAGFSLIGPGTGTGRAVSAEDAVRVTVRNGTLRNFGGAGATLGEQGIAEDLRIEDCPVGLLLDNSGCARRVHVRGAELGGMQVLFGCEIIDCVVENCGLLGIGSFFASAITRCSVRVSQGVGILAFGPVVVSDCSVVAIQGAGFQGSSGSVLEDCAASACGSGFLGDDGATIRNCTARACSVEGIAVEGTEGSALITDCHVEEAPIGIRVDRPATVARNYVNNTTVECIQISATDVTVLDNVLMNSPSAIHHLGTGNNCFYARNTYTGGVSLGVNATWGPLVAGAGNLIDDANSDHPWANIHH